MSNSSREREGVELIVAHPDLTEKGAKILAHAEGVPEIEVVKALQSLRARNDHLKNMTEAGAITTEAENDIERYKRLEQLFKYPFQYCVRGSIFKRNLCLHEFIPQLTRLCDIVSPNSDFEIEDNSYVALARWKSPNFRYSNYKPEIDSNNRWKINKKQKLDLDYIAESIKNRLLVDRKLRENRFHAEFNVNTKLLRMKLLIYSGSENLRRLQVSITPHPPAEFQYTPVEETQLRAISKQLKTYRIRA